MLAVAVTGFTGETADCFLTAESGLPLVLDAVGCRWFSGGLAAESTGSFDVGDFAEGLGGTGTLGNLPTRPYPFRTDFSAALLGLLPLGRFGVASMALAVLGAVAPC